MNNAALEYIERVVESILDECHLALRSQLGRKGAKKDLQLGDQQQHALCEGDIKVRLLNLPWITGVGGELNPLADPPTLGLGHGIGQRDLVGVDRHHLSSEESEQAAHLPVATADVDDAKAGQDSSD